MLPLALLLTLGPKRPSPLLHFILYLPILSSALIPCFGLYEEFLKLSFIATPLGVSLAQSCFLYPYILRPLEIELKKDNYHRERSALDIGLSLPKIFFFVTLPKLKGSLFTGLFFVFFGSYNDYLIPFLIGDAQISTLPLELYPLIFSGDRALSTVFILIYLIPLLLSLFLLRPFRSLYARS
jgi:ABC-type spermidine/putrescine transport system permease subunit II